MEFTEKKCLEVSSIKPRYRNFGASLTLLLAYVCSR